MKIALDATYSFGPNLSGVGVYSRRILYGLPATHPEAEYLFAYRPHRFFRSFSEALPSNSSRRLLSNAWPLSPDLFHGLNQRIDSTRYRRTISTFHDLFVLTGDYSTPDFRARFARQAREAAERSDLIIAVSRFTAGQVENLLKVDRARIRVVHHGVDHPLEAGLSVERDKTILFVGALQRRKNIMRLVEAFEQVAPGWKLVLAGASGFAAEEAMQLMEASPRKSDIQVLGYVPDASLEHLYQRAAIFAFPSLDEGFGMPVLDAMARGVPVLASAVSAMPEICGDAALLVDPHDIGAIAGGLKRLTEDPAIRADLARRGLERSKEFSWEKAVEGTWQVYQAVLG
ncbi:MAG TPA: glycosyltransferase family 1 protein [Bryobacteraceae bacterium]|nr:glycosyltransferase family 1 protein [Bryobacteraceae bacterium]